MRLILRSIPVFLLVLAGAAADDTSFTVTSATNANVGITADSLATIRGNKISTDTVSAGLPPWPFRLGDISVVYVTDSTGMQRMASILYVSPSQMNIRVP